MSTIARKEHQNDQNTLLVTEPLKPSYDSAGQYRPLPNVQKKGKGNIIEGMLVTNSSGLQGRNGRGAGVHRKKQGGR